ncbi:MAG: tnpA 1 [Gemmatimonadetes bacterium]|nr:tnpA 1 [Gemmatimonadota bacterium]
MILDLRGNAWVEAEVPACLLAVVRVVSSVTPTDFLGSRPLTPSAGSLEIPRSASSPSPGAQKNSLRDVWHCAPHGVLAANPHYTKRVALYVGKQCRSASINEMPADLHLDGHAAEEMEKLYMREQLALVGNPRPGVIGIDEISIRKGHVYRIVIIDLERGLPIWFGGVDRSAESLVMFYDFLGVRHTQRIRLAVMDMWKPFRNATEAQAPQAAILYGKFHVLRHLNEAMDQARKAEYKRLTNTLDRQYIKGQKYVLRSHRENRSPEK